MPKHLTSNWPAFLVIAAMFGVSVHYLGMLPDVVATHFDLHGRPDGYGSRAVALWLMPAVSFLTVLVVPALVSLSPQGYRMANSASSLARVNLAVALLLLALHVGILESAAEPGREVMPRFIGIGFGAFLLVLGNVLGKAERNFFVGIRTPWTLVSEDTWRATHRLAGKLMVAAGVLALAGAALGAPLYVSLVLLALALGIPTVYSYFAFRRFAG